MCVCCLQAEKKVKELQNELDDLSQRLDEAGGATQAQVSEIRIHPLIDFIETHSSYGNGHVNVSSYEQLL